MASPEFADRSYDALISVVIPSSENVAQLSSILERLSTALAQTPHELLVVYDGTASTAMVESLSHRPSALRIVRNEGRTPTDAFQTAFRAAAGDAVVTLNEGDVDDFSLIPLMAQMIRSGESDVVSANERRWRRLVDWTLFAVAGMSAADATTRFRAYATAFLDHQVVESTDDSSVGLELTVKAHLGEHSIGEVRPATPVALSPRSLRPYTRWLAKALQAPLVVWLVWVVMICAAVINVTLRSRGAVLGDYANIVLLAAAAFAFMIAARRVRQRMRIADAFFSLVLLNPLLYSRHAEPFDRTLLATGVLGLMTGAIIAMKRNNLLRYIAVMILALSLTALSSGFLMLLPALVVWLFAAGFALARSSTASSRTKGFVILGIGEVGLFIFGLACVLEESMQSPAPATLFSRIVGFVDFPLIVLAIIMVSLGWRKGPHRTTPPHFAGILALLVGLLTMLLNNFQSQELPAPGTDQTVLLICLVYTVFALHGPRRFRWLVPPALLLAAVAYTVFR